MKKLLISFLVLSMLSSSLMVSAKNDTDSNNYYDFEEIFQQPVFISNNKIEKDDIKEESTIKVYVQNVVKVYDEDGNLVDQIQLKDSSNKGNGNGWLLAGTIESDELPTNVKKYSNIRHLRDQNEDLYDSLYEALADIEDSGDGVMNVLTPEDLQYSLERASTNPNELDSGRGQGSDLQNNNGWELSIFVVKIAKTEEDPISYEDGTFYIRIDGKEVQGFGGEKKDLYTDGITVEGVLKDPFNTNDLDEIREILVAEKVPSSETVTSTICSKFDLDFENYTYYVQWYVVKYDNSDGWHIDGVLKSIPIEKPIEEVVEPEDPIITPVIPTDPEEEEEIPVIPETPEEKEEEPQTPTEPEEEKPQVPSNPEETEEEEPQTPTEPEILEQPKEEEPEIPEEKEETPPSEPEIPEEEKEQVPAAPAEEKNDETPSEAPSIPEEEKKQEETPVQPEEEEKSEEVPSQPVEEEKPIEEEKNEPAEEVPTPSKKHHHSSPTVNTEDIKEEEPPLSDAPVVEEPVEEIVEDEVPLTELPEIEDEEIPLSDIPQTGDVFDFATYAMSAFGSSVGLIYLWMKKKEN